MINLKFTAHTELGCSPSDYYRLYVASSEDFAILKQRGSSSEEVFVARLSNKNAEFLLFEQAAYKHDRCCFVVYKNQDDFDNDEAYCSIFVREDVEKSEPKEKMKNHNKTLTVKETSEKFLGVDVYETSKTNFDYLMEIFRQPNDKENILNEMVQTSGGRYGIFHPIDRRIFDGKEVLEIVSYQKESDAISASSNNFEFYIRCDPTLDNKKKEPSAKIAAKLKEQTKETNKMSTTDKKSTKDMVISSVKHGAAVGAADEASNAILELAKQMFGDNLPASLMESPGGRQVVKFMTAVGVHYLAQNSDFIPASEQVQVACGLVIEAVARDTIQPQMHKLTPLFAKIAKAGKA